jgi:hypothetical protein
MLKDLGRRCGLVFDAPARELIADVGGDVPFWVRMAGSHIHRGIEVEGRPTDIAPLLEEFVEVDGADIVRVALEHLRRVFPEAVELLGRCIQSGELDLSDGRLLTRYGVASGVGGRVRVTSAMARAGFKFLGESEEHASDQGGGLPTDVGVEPATGLYFTEGEWAEELAYLSLRRNRLERKLREFVRVVLKVQLPKDASWASRVINSLPRERRDEASSYAADVMMEKLYWRDLTMIVAKNWEYFEATFGDKKQFQLAMELLNDRPDAHAKEIDAADMALYRRYMDWLEERLFS